MKTYEIKYEPITLQGSEVKPKYNVYYYINNVFEVKEFHSIDGINGEIRQGYKLKTN